MPVGPAPFVVLTLAVFQAKGIQNMAFCTLQLDQVHHEEVRAESAFRANSTPARSTAFMTLRDSCHGSDVWSADG